MSFFKILVGLEIENWRNTSLFFSSVLIPSPFTIHLRFINCTIETHEFFERFRCVFRNAKRLFCTDDFLVVFSKTLNMKIPCLLFSKGRNYLIGIMGT